MKSKSLITAVACLLTAAGSIAAPITPEQALRRLGDAGAPATRAAGDDGTPVLALTKMSESGTPALYIFNKAPGSGFLVLPADDIAYPVLGYSDSGSFSESDMNPALEWWLSEYARQIEYAVAHGVSSTRSSVEIDPGVTGLQAISPMLKTSWDQVAPYNDQCPLLGVDRTYTGCVATAMAQVMNYWQYPEVGEGQIGYESSSIGKRLTLNFSKREFDWANMIPEYKDGNYTPEQADAVAYLMKACGYAVKMDYGTDSSGALAMNIANAMKKYFKYDPNILYTIRQYYSTTEWTRLIYDNLKNVGPILYGGASLLGGGHSFVCDGYDGNGYFHFNWGWTGMSDGYFSLDALNPSSLGSGGGTGGGYNFTQDAVLGIQPPTGEPEEYRPLYLTQMGSLAGVVKDGKLIFDLFAEEQAMWVNYNPVTMKVGFGAIFEPQGDTPGGKHQIPISAKKFSIQPGYGTNPELLKPIITLEDYDLSDGIYKVKVATFNPEDESEEWVPVRHNYGYYDNFLLKKNGSEYSVEVYDVADIGISAAEIVGDFFYGCPITVRATITNNFDIEISRGVAPAFVYNNSLCFLGQSIFVTVPPNSSIEREWTTPIFAMQGAPNVESDTEVYFTFFDEMTYNTYNADIMKPVTMRANPGPPSMMVNVAPQIRNASLEKEVVNGVEEKVYQIVDKSNIDIVAYVYLNSGYCNYPVYACITSEDQNNPGYMSIDGYGGHNMTITNIGRRQRFRTSLDFSKGVPGKIYTLVMAYEYGQELQAIKGPSAYLRILGSSGIDEVADDGFSLSYDKDSGLIKASSEGGIALLEVYDTAGKCVLSAESDNVCLEGIAGILLVRATDHDGNVKSLKVMR